MWESLSSRFPEVECWTAVVPHRDAKGLHLLVNGLGMRGIEFFNERHPPSSTAAQCPDPGDLGKGVFRLVRGRELE